MLTPSFDITQDEEFVIVTIRVPYVKASEAEFHIGGSEFKFHCKPYFLRLHLPGKLTEDGREKAVFDVGAGTMVVHLPKLQPGEHFENLGMLTALLSKKPAKAIKSEKPLVEVIGGDSNDGSSAESEEEFDWEVEQVLPEEEEVKPKVTLSLTPNSASYGFANRHQGVFTKLKDEIPSIIDCPDPDHMTSHERRVACIAHEEVSFSPDHYLADLMDNPTIEGLLQYQPPWRKELDKWKQQKSEAATAGDGASVKPSKRTEAGQDIVTFLPSEKEKLKDLPNKDYLLDKATVRCLYLGLIDIIFAFAYDHHTTEGEGNVESAWTICKLSPTLSWLEVYRGSVHDVVYSSLRRSLCYPLYRHWQLSLAILQDTKDIFRLGRRKLLQCLLSIHHSLGSSDPYYILNNLYLTDYCVWIQKASVRHIQSLADDLDEVCVTKESLGFELLELEVAAQMVLEGATHTDSDTDSEQSTSSEESEQSSSDTSESSANEARDNGDIVREKGDNIKAEDDKNRGVKDIVENEGDNVKNKNEGVSDIVMGEGDNMKYKGDKVEGEGDNVKDEGDKDKVKSERSTDMLDSEEQGEERAEPVTLTAPSHPTPGLLEQLLNLNIAEVSDSADETP